MTTKMQMVTRRQFGFSNKAQLNRALLDALNASTELCETCSEIRKELEPNEEGGEFVEAASFPGRSVQKLDAHFKYHWKTDYELVDLVNARPSK